MGDFTEQLKQEIKRLCNDNLIINYVSENVEYPFYNITINDGRSFNVWATSLERTVKDVLSTMQMMVDSESNQIEFMVL